MGKTHPVMKKNKPVGPPTTRCICADCGMTQYSPREGLWFVRIMTTRGFQWASRPTPEPVCSVSAKRFDRLEDPRDDIEVSMPKIISIPLVRRTQ